MDPIDVWNDLGWVDGVLFTIWIGVIYYGKCWIDYRFNTKKKENKTTYPEFVKKYYKQ